MTTMSDHATEATAKLLDDLAQLFSAKRDTALERALLAETALPTRNWHRGAASAFNECSIECSNGAKFMREP